MRRLLRKILVKHKTVLLDEAAHLSGFMHLLMKERNSGARWTRAERESLKRHIKHLSFYVPVIIAFMLPGGILLLPVLAEVLDRRRMTRKRATLASDECNSRNHLA